MLQLDAVGSAVENVRTIVEQALHVGAEHVDVNRRRGAGVPGGDGFGLGVVPAGLWLHAASIVAVCALAKEVVNSVTFGFGDACITAAPRTRFQFIHGNAPKLWMAAIVFVLCSFLCPGFQCG